jgi:hypothetical protein
MRVRCSFGLALGLCSIVCASSLGKAAAQPADAAAQGRARDEYAAGVAAFQRGDDAQACAHFSAADAAFSSPNVKLMLGRTLLRQGQPVAAHAALTAAVREARAPGGERYEQTAAAADQELQQLAAQLAIINVRVDDPTGSASLRVGAREIPRDAWQDPIVAEPGAIEIELTGPSGRHDVKLLEMTGGTAATLAMSLPEASPPTAAGPSGPEKTVLPSAPAAAVAAEPQAGAARPLSYVAAGVGAAGIVAFGVFGALSSAEFDKLDHACPSRTDCDPALQTHATEGQTYQTLANVSLGVGIAALVAGAVLWVISAPDDKPPTSTARAAQLSGSF